MRSRGRTRNQARNVAHADATVPLPVRRPARRANRTLARDTVTVRCLCERAEVRVAMTAVRHGRTGCCGTARCEALAQRHPDLVAETSP